MWICSISEVEEIKRMCDNYNSYIYIYICHSGKKIFFAVLVSCNFRNKQSNDSFLIHHFDSDVFICWYRITTTERKKPTFHRLTEIVILGNEEFIFPDGNMKHHRDRS